MVYLSGHSRGRAHAGVFSCLLALGLAWVLVLSGCTPPNTSGSSSASNGSASSSNASSASTSNTSASSADSANSASSADSSSAASAVSAADVDVAATFPSWNRKSSSLKQLIAFVASVTDKSSEDYVPPEDRIATFDMDGTIICEKAPVYVDYMMLLHRVLDNPSYNEEGYKPSEETKKICQGIRDTVMAGEKYSSEQSADKARLIASEFAGMTCEEFRLWVQSFARSQQAVGFSGMTYAESFYKPMLEVMDFLRANDFDIWMVSACEREVVRGLVPLAFYVPYDHIIGTDVGYNTTSQGSASGDEYNMGLGENILLGTPLGEETGKANKSIAIMREIGKRPILAFGNSSGDYSMLNYAQSNPDHKGMGVLVLCDDTNREYGDLDRAAEQTEEAEKNGWTLFHMSTKDWDTIYDEKVVKTELPGANADANAELAAAA
ncbi:MAG: HAD family hydrolase [Coriobacteriales bacterium]|nr:HAD family hydrolase [Coriobacteriales bacterium]